MSFFRIDNRKFCLRDLFLRNIEFLFWIFNIDKLFEIEVIVIFFLNFIEKKKIVFCEINFKKFFYKIKMIWKIFYEYFYLSWFVYIVIYMYIYIYSVCWNIYEKKSCIFGYFGFRKNLFFILLICNIVKGIIELKIYVYYIFSLINIWKY